VRSLTDASADFQARHRKTSAIANPGRSLKIGCNLYCSLFLFVGTDCVVDVFVAQIFFFAILINPCKSVFVQNISLSVPMNFCLDLISMKEL